MNEAVSDRHLIVVSVDAMVCEDLEVLSKLPNVGGLMARGSMIRHVRTIYPSLTHPVHATLMTGCAAGATGIPGNETFIPGRLRTPWYNRLDEVRCDTLFHASRRAGLTTAACRWPLTAGGFDVIDFLVPEVLDDELKAQPDLETLYRGACTPCLFDDIVKPNLRRLNGNKHPEDENFSIACASEIFRKYQPNLLMTHPCLVDSMRHRKGLFGSHVDEALHMTDAWIGQLLDAVRDCGAESSTSFAIVSDHGQLEIKRNIALNVFLRDRGFLTTDSAGNLTQWRAYAKSCGLSAQVYVKDVGQVAAVGKALDEMREEGIYGISQVLSASQARERYGLFGDFSFVVESDGFTSFHDDWRRPAVRPLDDSDYRYGRATHGHMPEKGPQPPMLVSGPVFRQGVVLEEGSVLDEAPTFAEALGVQLPVAQGKPIWALLADTR